MNLPPCRQHAPAPSVDEQRGDVHPPDAGTDVKRPAPKSWDELAQGSGSHMWIAVRIAGSSMPVDGLP